jgi:septal ring factor EnvC (AmiA/AmiB activator)
VKSLLLWCFVAVALVHGASTTAKIKSSKKDLQATSSAKKKASRKLEKIAADIAKAEKDITYLEKKLETLGENKEKREKEYKVLKKELKDSENILKNTSSEIEKKHKAFIELLSEQFSVIFAMQQFDNPTQNSVISYEVYQAYKKHNAKQLQSLKKEITTLRKKKDDKKYQRNKTKNSIASLEKKEKSYIKQKKEKEKLVKRLGNDEEKYQAKLQGLVDKQGSLRNTLAKLNILHKKEVDEARKRAAARKEAIRLEKERKRKIRQAKAAAREKARKAKAAIKLAKTKEAKQKARAAAKKAEKEAKLAQNKVYKQSEKVRKVHSSYKKSKTYAYKGGKTISPIPGARLIKKFGTYVDPVYKIKIFNESVTLKAPSSNAKVKNVLNGKVVFAGKSSMLGKVVVVAHSGKIHTVYAGLSKIAPNIRVGRKIQKGYVVGKVASKLMFQATKNSKHINPMKLIRI